MNKGYSCVQKKIVLITQSMLLMLKIISRHIRANSHFNAKYASWSLSTNNLAKVGFHSELLDVGDKNTHICHQHQTNKNIRWSLNYSILIWCNVKTLKAHIRAHNDKFKIKCTFCNQRFVNNRNMKAHIRSVHPEPISAHDKNPGNSKIPMFFPKIPKFGIVTELDK